MSAENNSDVAVEPVTETNNKGAGDEKVEIKGTKRPADQPADDVKKIRKEENGEEEEDEEDFEEEEDDEPPEGEEESDEGEGGEDLDEIEGEEDEEAEEEDEGA